jgi:hypothetical protein
MHNDSRGKPSKALDVLKKLRSRPDVTTDTKKLLKAVELAVSNNDEFTIRMVMQYDVEQLTLFGLDSDINAMLNASFANIKSRATAKRGESHVALFELK